MPRTRATPIELAQRGELVVQRDPRRASGRLLRQAGMDASYVDLADVRHLEFAYLRWIRITLNAARARRVLHIGGGACALPRALAAERPDGLQEVCEIDPDVLAIAREHLGLRRAPGLRVRVADGREHLSRQPDSSWDAVVVDAFVGARVPSELNTPAAAENLARVAPLALINVVDDRTRRAVDPVELTLAAVYPHVLTIGARAGNAVVVAHRGTGLDMTRLAARLAADPSPARLSPERTARGARDARSRARDRATPP